MKIRRVGSVLAALWLAYGPCVADAATWRGVVDVSSFTWARLVIINNSASDSNWSISGGRTAVSSAAAAAEIDAEYDWNGVVPAGQAVYVWVYGRDLGDVSIANADGGSSAFFGTVAPDLGGDGEVVIVIAADGTPTVSIEPSDAYAAPAITGVLPD